MAAEQEAPRRSTIRCGRWIILHTLQNFGSNSPDETWHVISLQTMLHSHVNENKMVNLKTGNNRNSVLNGRT
jgi:hypothetical protein